MSLKCCENEDMLRLVPTLRGAPDTAASLLVECRGEDGAALAARIEQVQAALRRSSVPLLGGGDIAAAYPFTSEERVTKIFWDMRKGLVPLVGGQREPG